MVSNPFPFKVISVLGKVRSCRVPNLGCRGAESPGWFDVSLKNSAWDVMHEQVCCCDEAVSHQLLIAAASWIIRIVSVEVRSSLTQNLMQIHSLLYLLSHFECNGHTVYTSLNCGYCLHWLIQWSHHCSHMLIPVHFPWLPGYTDVRQTILIILTMLGLFPDRPHT